jgi:hypothetical protein
MFKTRYATFGFNDSADLDDGAMWPTSFALTKLTAAEEARIGALVKKAGWLRTKRASGPSPWRDRPSGRRAPDPRSPAPLPPVGSRSLPRRKTRRRFEAD